MTVAFCGEGAEVLLCKRNVTLRTAVKRRPVPTRNNALYFCSSSYSVSRRQFAAGLSLLAFLRPAWPLSSFHPQNSVALAIEGDLQRLTHTRSPLDAAVTDKVFLEIKIAGKPVGRLLIGLFGDDAPQSVSSFKKICSGTLRGRGGRTVSYTGSQAWRVLKGDRIDMGRVKQIDEINQSPGTPQRQLVLVEVPLNNDSNNISHNMRGVVSVRKGGGRFEFVITTTGDFAQSLDQENIAIGRVLDGIDVVDMMDRVPTNQKTPRDGFRQVGRLIGDGRAKLDLEFKPLQKISVSHSGVLE